MVRPLRVGVVGVGAMGKNHARLYSEFPGVELIGVADVNETLVTSIAQSYGCKPFADYHKLLDENLDVLSIAMPTTLHRGVALDAIEEGINILVEKPIADTVENADEIIRAAREKGVKLMVGHTERFNPAIIKLKELIDNGLLGNVVSISAKRVGRYNPRIKDVGIIIDLGTHDIDIMSYLYGERIKEVYASAGSVVHSHEDHAIITLNFDSGSSGVIDTNWLTPHKVRSLTVIGSQGIAEVNCIEETLRIFDQEWIRDAKIEKEEPLKLELLHFIDCVQNDKEPLVSGEEGKHALEVALGAVESARTGKVCEIIGENLPSSMRKPICLFVARDDYANLGYLLSKSLNSVGVEAKAISFNPNDFNYPETAEICDMETYFRYAANAEIIVAMQSQYFQCNLNGKKLFVFHGGSIYRHNSSRLNNAFNQIVTGTILQTWNFLDRGAKNQHWLLPPVDTKLIQPDYIYHNKLFAHYPHKAGMKGSDKIIETLKETKAKFIYDYTTVDWLDNLKRVAECDIYIEQLWPNEWGLTALEAAALGKIVITTFRGLEDYRREYGECELVVANTEDELKQQVNEIMTWSTAQILKKKKATRKWAEKYHSLEAVGQRLKKVIG